MAIWQQFWQALRGTQHTLLTLMPLDEVRGSTHPSEVPCLSHEAIKVLRKGKEEKRERERQGRGRDEGAGRIFHKHHSSSESRISPRQHLSGTLNDNGRDFFYSSILRFYYYLWFTIKNKSMDGYLAGHSNFLSGRLKGKLYLHQKSIKLPGSLWNPKSKVLLACRGPSVTAAGPQMTVGQMWKQWTTQLRSGSLLEVQVHGPRSQLSNHVWIRSLWPFWSPMVYPLLYHNSIMKDFLGKKVCRCHLIIIMISW